MDLILLVLVKSLLIVGREGKFVSGMENGGEKEVCTDSECGALLSLPKAKSSEALDEVDRLSSPFALVDGVPRDCCCCLAEGVGE